MGGVFERHPKLVFCMTEQGCAWIPGVLKMLDGFHAQMASGRMGEIKFDADDQLSMKPSEYFARNCFVGVSFPNQIEAAAMKTVGIESCMWGSDYPHHESTYPYTTEGLRLAFADWDEADVRRVVTDNAARIYGFDVDALMSVAEKVGPTVDEIKVPLEDVPRDSGSPAFTTQASR
jgi:predicted TIM-barrel fold metal-dependent hydrolase